MAAYRTYGSWGTDECDNETNNPYEKARRVKAGIGTEWTIANDGHGQQNAVAE